MKQQNEHTTKMIKANQSVLAKALSAPKSVIDLPKFDGWFSKWGAFIGHCEFLLGKEAYSPGLDIKLLITTPDNAAAIEALDDLFEVALSGDTNTKLLFNNSRSQYFHKGFEKLQLLKDTFASTDSGDVFCLLFELFANEMGQKERIIQYEDCFKSIFTLLADAGYPFHMPVQVMCGV